MNKVTVRRDNDFFTSDFSDTAADKILQSLIGKFHPDEPILSANESFVDNGLFARLLGAEESAKPQCKKISELTLNDLMLDRQALADPMRLATRQTQIMEAGDDGQFHEMKYYNYFQQIHDAIANDQTIASEEERKECLVMLDALELFSQLLFIETMAEYYFDQFERVVTENSLGFDAEKMQVLKKSLSEQKLDEEHFSKLDVLKNHKEFMRTFNELLQSIEQQMKLPANKEKRQEFEEARRYLRKTEAFFHQKNDLNFHYAEEPSRSYSQLRRSLEKWGGRIALAAGIGSIVCKALVLCLMLLPFAFPPLLISSIAIAGLAFTAAVLVTGLPIAFKNIGTIIYNYARFDATPTKSEIINVVLFGTAVALFGAFGLLAGAVHSACGHQIIGATKLVNSTSRKAMGVFVAIKNGDHDDQETIAAAKHIIKPSSDMGAEDNQDKEGMMPKE